VPGILLNSPRAPGQTLTVCACLYVNGQGSAPIGVSVTTIGASRGRGRHWCRLAWLLASASRLRWRRRPVTMGVGVGLILDTLSHTGPWKARVPRNYQDAMASALQHAPEAVRVWSRRGVEVIAGVGVWVGM